MVPFQHLSGEDIAGKHDQPPCEGLLAAGTAMDIGAAIDRASVESAASAVVVVRGTACVTVATQPKVLRSPCPNARISAFRRRGSAWRPWAELYSRLRPGTAGSLRNLPQNAVVENDTGPTGAVGSHGPSIRVASTSPGQGGIVMHRNRSGSAPVQRYWKAVPNGMSMETPGVRTVTASLLSSRRQISPWPDKTCQNSLTVAWTVARFT